MQAYENKTLHILYKTIDDEVCVCVCVYITNSNYERQDTVFFLTIMCEYMRHTSVPRHTGCGTLEQTTGSVALSW
jgi:hypothetical protein